MKKAIAVLILALAVTVFGVTTAWADGAIITKDFNCFVTPAAWSGPITLITSDSHSTVTPRGNTVLHCNFDIPGGFEPDRAVRINDFTCSTFAGFTTKTHSVSSPGGNVKLTCHINGSN